MIRAFGVVVLDWVHILALLLWCGLRVFSISLFDPTVCVSLLVFQCRTSGDFGAFCTRDCSYGGWPMKAAFDDTFCMWLSHDMDPDTVVDVYTLGVVDLDTSIMPDVFGLRAFDSGESFGFYRVHSRTPSMCWCQMPLRCQEDFTMWC